MNTNVSTLAAHDGHLDGEAKAVARDAAAHAASKYRKEAALRDKLTRMQARRAKRIEKLAAWLQAHSGWSSILFIVIPTLLIGDTLLQGEASAYITNHSFLFALLFVSMEVTANASKELAREHARARWLKGIGRWYDWVPYWLAIAMGIGVVIAAFLLAFSSRLVEEVWVLSAEPAFSGAWLSSAALVIGASAIVLWLHLACLLSPQVYRSWGYGTVWICGVVAHLLHDRADEGRERAGARAAGWAEKHRRIVREGGLEEEHLSATEDRLHAQVSQGNASIDGRPDAQLVDG